MNGQTQTPVSLVSDLGRQVEQLLRLFEVSESVAALLDLDPLLQQIVDAATQLLNAEMGTFWCSAKTTRVSKPSRSVAGPTSQVAFRAPSASTACPVARVCPCAWTTFAAIPYGASWNGSSWRRSTPMTPTSAALICATNMRWLRQQRA